MLLILSMKYISMQNIFEVVGHVQIVLFSFNNEGVK